MCCCFFIFNFRYVKFFDIIFKWVKYIFWKSFIFYFVFCLVELDCWEFLNIWICFLVIDLNFFGGVGILGLGRFFIFEILSVVLIFLVFFIFIGVINGRFNEVKILLFNNRYSFGLFLLILKLLYFVMFWEVNVKSRWIF